MYHFQMQSKRENGWTNWWKKLDVIC